MPERGPHYYDTHLQRVGRPLERSPWKPLYEAAANLCPSPQNDVAIADLGSGTGRFAKQLFQLGHRRYIGVDFSPKRVDEARRYVPKFEFVCADLFSAELPAAVWEADVFTALEVLEHIRRDLDLLARVPVGKTAVVSVPNFPDPAHVRHFRDVGQAKARYQQLLNIDHASVLRVGSKHRIFLFCGKRI